jgi:hypothetical protein
LNLWELRSARLIEQGSLRRSAEARFSQNKAS